MKWRVYTAERGMLLDGEQASEIARAPGGERRRLRRGKRSGPAPGWAGVFESGGAQADLVEGCVEAAKKVTRASPPLQHRCPPELRDPCPFKLLRLDSPRLREELWKRCLPRCSCMLADHSHVWLAQTTTTPRCAGICRGGQQVVAAVGRL